MDMRKYANDVLRDVHGTRAGADAIPEKNRNERENELEDDLSEAVKVAHEISMKACDLYLTAQDRHTAFLLLRNERDELKEKP